MYIYDSWRHRLMAKYLLEEAKDFANVEADDHGALKSVFSNRTQSLVMEKFSEYIVCVIRNFLKSH